MSATPTVEYDGHTVKDRTLAYNADAVAEQLIEHGEVVLGLNDSTATATFTAEFITPISDNPGEAFGEHVETVAEDLDGHEILTEEGVLRFDRNVRRVSVGGR